MSLQQYKQAFPAAFQPDYPQIPQSFEPANEDKLRLLQLYDTVFLVDDSTSMIQIDGQVCPSLRFIVLMCLSQQYCFW